MAASQTTIALRNSTNAEFRAIGAFIYAGLVAGGWTRVATDIDWTTVNAPAQNTYAGYEVWKSPDETGLTNFYVKLRHGSNNNVAPAYALAYSVSWGWTSGSTLDGIPTTEVTSQASTGAGASNTRLCTIAAGNGYAAICLGGGAATNGGHLLIIERTRDAALASQDELAIVGQYYSAAIAYNNKVYTSDSLEITNSVATNGSGSWFGSPPITTAATVSRGAVRLNFMTPGRLYATSPISTYFGFPSAVLGAAGEQITVPVYGVSHTFMILGNTGNAPGGYDGTGTFYGLIRFD